MLLPRDDSPVDATPETLRVVASNYACMGITIIVLGTRAFLTLFRWKRSIGLDDILLYLSLATGITESIMTEHAVRRGLGTYIRPGNSAKLQRLSELIYASDLLFLITLFLAKLSVVRMVYRFASRSAVTKGKLFILQILIIVWGLFSVPAIAFQCGTPLPWLYLPSRCTGSGALWYPTITMSIFIDAMLAFCAWPAVPELPFTPKQRQTVLGLFSTRILACILAVIHLALLAPALKNVNQPRAMPNPTVLKSLVMNMSIITAAIPALHKALASFVPDRSAQAVIYGSDERQITTPLDEIKRPGSAADPNPKKFNGFIKETEIGGAPTLGTGMNDFSSRFSLAFNKEIEISTSRV